MLNKQKIVYGRTVSEELFWLRRNIRAKVPGTNAKKLTYI